jgi:hypothetical protein
MRSGKYARGDGGEWSGSVPYTLPEMFGISTDPANLSVVRRFHNG